MLGLDPPHYCCRAVGAARGGLPTGPLAAHDCDGKGERGAHATWWIDHGVGRASVAVDV